MDEVLGPGKAWQIRDFPIALREQIARAANHAEVTVAEWLIAHFRRHGVADDGVKPVCKPVELAELGDLLVKLSATRGNGRVLAALRRRMLRELEQLPPHLVEPPLGGVRPPLRLVQQPGLGDQQAGIGLVGGLQDGDPALQHRVVQEHGQGAGAQGNREAGEPGHSDQAE